MVSLLSVSVFDCIAPQISQTFINFSFCSKGLSAEPTFPVPSSFYFFRLYTLRVISSAYSRFPSAPNLSAYYIKKLILLVSFYYLIVSMHYIACQLKLITSLSIIKLKPWPSQAMESQFSTLTFEYVHQPETLTLTITLKMYKIITKLYKSLKYRITNQLLFILPLIELFIRIAIIHILVLLIVPFSTPK